MKNRGLFCIAIFVAGIFFVTAQSQTPPPILVDELGVHGCEDFASRVDSWIQESKRRPELVPYAIVTGPASDLRARITYREWIKGQLTWRFEDKAVRERFRILEGNLTVNPRIEFWLASKDDATIIALEKRWDLSLSLKKSEPYYQSHGDGGICPFIDHALIFKQLIEANPGLNGRVIFHEKDWRKFASEKAEFLAKGPKLSSNRFSFVRPRTSDYFYDGHVEYWFVPAKGVRP